MIFHDIRALLVCEKFLGFGVTILQVNFGGLLVGIWRSSTKLRSNFIAARLRLKDQVVPSNLVFRFAAIQVTVCKIRPFEGESAESAKSAEFAFLQKSQI